MTRPKRAIIYARVSTRDQTVENQVRELRRVAEDSGLEVVDVLTDSATGANTERPGFEELMRRVRRSGFPRPPAIDQVMVWSVDRIARKLEDLVRFLRELHEHGVDVFIHKQGIDTRTSTGKAMFQMIGVFAEFEREIIRERIHAGLERAKAQGKRLGRPPVEEARPKLEGRVLELRAKGWGIHKIRKHLSCGAGTVQRILGEAS